MEIGEGDRGLKFPPRSRAFFPAHNHLPEAHGVDEGNVAEVGEDVAVTFVEQFRNGVVKPGVTVRDPDVSGQVEDSNLPRALDMVPHDASS